jgi:hypothetical protein
MEFGELDVADRVAETANLFAFGEHGGFAAYWTAPWTREVHTFILPSGRGRWALRAAHEAIEIARQHGTSILWTRVPASLPNVRAFAKGMGMSATGEVIVTFGEPWDVYAMMIH